MTAGEFEQEAVAAAGRTSERRRFRLSSAQGPRAAALAAAGLEEDLWEARIDPQELEEARRELPESEDRGPCSQE